MAILFFTIGLRFNRHVWAWRKIFAVSHCALLPSWLAMFFLSDLERLLQGFELRFSH
jgi:hypothetical protein